MELKTPQQHRPSKEPVAKTKKVVTPTSVVPVKTTVVEKEPEAPKTKSFDSSLRRVSTKKVKKEPTLESRMEMEEEGSSEDMEEVEVEDSSEEPESEEDEEVELETPLPEKTRIQTWTSERHKATPALKILVFTKRSAKRKMPKKGVSSQKKPRKK